MKKSNIALFGLACTLLVGMITTGFILKEEAAKIDLTDPTRNYLTQTVAAFKVVKISGSNGYPIEIESGNTNSVSVLRRRQSFLEMKTVGDTLEIIFSGSNIPLHRADQPSSPVGIVIKSNAVTQIHNKNTYLRVKGFKQQTLALQLKENAFTDITNCRLSSLSIKATGNSRLAFKEQNTADTLNLELKNTTFAHLKDLNFSVLNRSVGDSTTVIFSNKAMAQLERKEINN
jgi:hypothetical protein